MLPSMSTSQVYLAFRVASTGNMGNKVFAEGGQQWMDDWGSIGEVRK
jgi:hypothetical protein